MMKQQRSRSKKHLRAIRSVVYRHIWQLIATDGLLRTHSRSHYASSVCLPRCIILQCTRRVVYIAGPA